ncbi:MAG: copper oxidase [Planctomycetes bacterium]|nr:copper oxidase [Planctomycetota bacterium]
MLDRRNFLFSTGAALAAANVSSWSTTMREGTSGFTPVVTPNGSTLAYELDGDVKVFRLVAEPIEREFAPGMLVRAWGYNGETPGPTIECVQGDRVRILVTNRLPEHTTIHWHGLRLPNGMDGVGGLNQAPIRPGETWAYEFVVRDAGTFMYHPHADEMLQMAVGLMGMFIVHPRVDDERVDRDFVLLPHEWAIHPGTYRPDPTVMTDFNLFTFNGKVFPAIEPLVVRTGERVRLRIGNLSMDSHPIHLHGYSFDVTATDGGRIPKSARWPQTTVNVPVGSTRDVEWIADAPGDWALHCHKSHHTMNAMGHGLPNLLGADVQDLEARLKRLVPGAMLMGSDGMAAHAAHGEHMQRPPNTLPMMTGTGPYGSLEMGGMFTVLKVRDEIAPGVDPGWYEQPPGTSARRVE